MRSGGGWWRLRLVLSGFGRCVAAGGACLRLRLFPTRLFDNDSVAIERTARWEEPQPSPPARRCAGPAARWFGLAIGECGRPAVPRVLRRSLPPAPLAP